MKRAFLTLVAIGLAVAALPARSVQQSSDDERRAAITVLRAINTAENAAKGTGGKYLPLSELLNHPAMARVKPNIAVDGNTYTHAGAGVRLALSADATQYVVTVVSAAPTYTAAFSDERGVIYTGKALE
jgi:type II secretory pathway pseudopilin PulG